MLFLFLSSILHVVPKFLEAEAEEEVEVEAVGVVLLFRVHYSSIKEIEVDPKDTRANRWERFLLTPIYTGLLLKKKKSPYTTRSTITYTHIYSSTKHVFYRSKGDDNKFTPGSAGMYLQLAVTA